MELWKTKLNKLLFYADFCHYRKTGYSMTGIAYRAISYGPVPAEYQMLYVKLCEDQKIEISQREFASGYYGEVISPIVSFDSNAFTRKQMDILEEVANTFASKNTTETVQLSHEESAWFENEEDKKMISYQKYAFLITGVPC
jgi:uncharacterized phage-associated protein